MWSADWVSSINELAIQGQPFLFIINFDGTRAYVTELDELDPGFLRYSFPNHSNIAAGQNKKAGRIFNCSLDIASEKSRMQKAIQEVQEAERAGYSYLTNICFGFRAQIIRKDPDVLADLRARYLLWMRDEFLCYSPEPFIRITGDTIESYPMKGTLPAVRNPENLLSDEKELAEHFTIVDLIRNDLGRVAGQVQVTKFRYLEKIILQSGAIYQTSSCIVGKLKKPFDKEWGSLLKELLPAGSISGAPKIETLRLIQKVEEVPRNFFTGVAGVFNGSHLECAVLIRFLDLARSLYMAGAGITVYSSPEKEAEEILTKIYVPAT